MFEDRNRIVGLPYLRFISYFERGKNTFPAFAPASIETPTSSNYVVDRRWLFVKCPVSRTLQVVEQPSTSCPSLPSQRAISALAPLFFALELVA